MNDEREGNEMIRALLSFSSFGNILGGASLLALVALGVTAYPGHRFPPVAIAVGGVLLIQGLYSSQYAGGWWRAWDEAASGALLAGQIIAGCIAIATIVYAVFYNPRAANGGVEPAPFFSGAMIGINSFLALILLSTTDVLKPQTRGREGT